GTVKEVSDDETQAVLKLHRKEVRDLYEAEIVTIRVLDTNITVNLAVVKKEDVQVRVKILPDQDLEGFEANAEFVFIDDNRQPSYIVWGRESSDIPLSDFHIAQGQLKTGFRTVQVAGESYSAEYGIGGGISALYRAQKNAGFGLDLDGYAA